jgi:hypothetical protein
VLYLHASSVKLMLACQLLSLAMLLLLLLPVLLLLIKAQ